MRQTAPSYLSQIVRAGLHPRGGPPRVCGVSRPVDALLDFLRAQEAKGVTHVHLDDDARALLRQLHLQGKQAAVVPDRGPVAAPVPFHTPVTQEAGPAYPETTPAADPTPAPPARTATRTIEPAGPAPATGTTRAERIASLASQAERWQPARALGSLRETMVFSTGNPEAKLMLVGEAPGHQEERQREPFVGPAGQKLDEILKAMGLSRAEVYISNIVKFRPAMPNQTTNNRKPTIEEMATCLPFIRGEIEIVQPTCIVALGATAAEGLLGLTETVGQMRGRWHQFAGVPVRVTYHPSYLLRTQSALTEKRKLWEDMLAVMETLELPISDKQRGFFLPKP